MKLFSSMSAKDRMIQQHLIARGVVDDRVLHAMRSVPRERFVPEESQSEAYEDCAMSIGHGQTISQPYIVALMTEKLEPAAGLRVLEVGTGSGYQTAVLAALEMQVYTMERVKPLLDETFERLASLGIKGVRYRFGDGTKGWPEHAPFDRILIAAGAPELPRHLLLEQLADAGVAVLPAGPMEAQSLLQVRRQGPELITKVLCGVRFVKLVGEGAWDDE
ncbi:MAG: protein-L-isoaspartate(D-aspartate) O-methyltransferase [Tepidisphaerales bacterium]